MLRSQNHRVRGKQWGGGNVPPPLLLCSLLLIFALSGCAPKSYEPAPSLQPPVATAERDQAEKAITHFADSVKQGDYDSVRSQFAPSLRTKAPASLAAWLKEGHYEPFTGASGWRYDEVTHIARGKKLLVRAGFTGADGASYRTNVTLVPDTDGTLRIESVLAPTKPRPPIAAQGAAASAPGK